MLLLILIFFCFQDEMWTLAIEKCLDKFLFTFNCDNESDATVLRAIMRDCESRDTTTDDTVWPQIKIIISKFPDLYDQADVTINDILTSKLLNN